MKKLTHKDEAIIETALKSAWAKASDEEKHRFFLAYIKNPKAASSYMVESLNAKYESEGWEVEEALVESGATIKSKWVNGVAVESGNGYYSVNHGTGTACWNVEDDF